MEKKFWTRKEVAGFLTISVGTLANYGSRHAVYKPDNAGSYHYRHVEILEDVHAKILSPEVGMELWNFKKMHARRAAMQQLKVESANSCSRSKQRGQQHTSRKV